MQVAQEKPAVAPNRIVRILAAALILAAIFVIVIPGLPFAPGSGLDSSWIIGINLAHFHRMIFGQDIIFTYGPLGYLIAPSFPYANLWAEFAFAWGIAFITAYALWVLCRRARRWTEMCLYLGMFWVYSAFAMDSQLERPLGAVLALTLAIAIRLDESPWFDVGLLAILSAAALLTKFNIGIIASSAAFYLAACLVWRGRSTLNQMLKPAAAVVLVWLITFAGLYWMLDGTLLGLSAFLRNSMAIADGYSAAMGLAGPMWPAVCAVASCVVLCVFVPFAAGSIRRTAWGIPLLIAISFLCFKSAMVREDSHAYPFPFEMGVLALLILALASTPRSRFVVGLFAAASIVFGVAQLDEPPYPAIPVERLEGLAALANLNQYLHWPAAVAAMAQSTQRFLIVDRLPHEFGPYVEGKRVTAYPTEIAMLPANHLRWQPLPVIQAYSAYTPALDSLNANALASAAGPNAILLQWDAIDGRQPFYESPRSWWAILDWYDLKQRSLNWPQSVCVLTRRSTPRFESPVPAGTLVAHWGQKITLPPVAADEALLMQADIGESLTGLVKRELFRGTPITVRATLGSGFIESRRLIRVNLPEGVLVSDWPNSLGPLAAMMAGRGSFTKDRVVSISFHTYRPGDFRPAIRIRWSRVKLRLPMT
jgi:hypothetical protein